MPKKCIVLQQGLQSSLFLEPGQIGSNGASHQSMLLKGHLKLIMHEHVFQDGFKRPGFGTEAHDLICNLMDLLDIVFSQRRNIIGGCGMGGSR